MAARPNSKPEAPSQSEPDPLPQPRGRKRMLRAARWILFGVCGLLLAGIVYQAIGTAIDMRRFPPPGRLVEVDGHGMHIHCLGEGSPTVILDTLSGGISSYWGWIQPELARHTRVCAYDRPGQAWSKTTPAQPLSQGVSTLHSLLVNAGESPPYLLAGHSLGGIYALVYTHQYPNEVVGLVLVDSAHPSQFARFPELAESNREFLATVRTFPWIARLGLARLYFDLGGQMDFGTLPAQSFAEAVAWWSNPDYYNALVNDMERAEINYAYAHATLNGMSLHTLPLAVVSADPTVGQVFPGWDDLQTELATLSSNALRLQIPGTDHISLVYHPEYAQTTAAVIVEMLAGLRE